MKSRFALQAARQKVGQQRKNLANQLIIGATKKLSVSCISAARVQFVFSAWESTVHEEADPKFKPEVLH